MHDAVVQAHDDCTNHKDLIERSRRCGCFSCLSIFPPRQITDWTDEGRTARCPRCGMNAVLPDAAGFPVTRDFLTQMKARWF